MALERDALLNLQTIQLRAFAALAEQGSYTRVARQLSYTEPAVNMQIKSLERVIGLPLVRREGKRVLLTTEGLRLLPLVLDVLARNQELESAIRRMQPTSRLVIGAGRHTGVFMLMPLLPEFRRATGVEPELHFLPQEDLAAGLLSGRFDLLVAGMSDEVLPKADRMRHGIVRVPWKRVDWALVAQPAVSARRLPARPRTATTVFFPDYAFRRRELMEEACRKHFPDLHMVSLETAEAVKSAVCNGLGAGVLPLAAIESETANGTLTVIADIEFGPIRSHLVHHREDLKPPARRLIEYLLTVERSSRHRRRGEFRTPPGPSAGVRPRPVARMLG